VSGLEQATLQRLTGLDRAGKDSKATPRADGDPIPVQFNPASLHISRKNNVDEGGVTAKTQKRQHPSQQGSTLSFDLEFDTAEQGSPGSYVDVRRWTALVRQFVEPPPTQPKNPSPAVRFAWGTLVYDGIIGEITEELDYFAPDGTPLHAKVSVKIDEQNFQYEANREGPGTRDDSAATSPGGSASRTTPARGLHPPPGAGPGSSGTSSPQLVVQARAGESVQELVAREGLDPAAWRAAMEGLDSPISLEAGASVQLGAEITAGIGIGLTAGFTAGPAPASPQALAAALGAPQPADDGPAADEAAGDPRAAGFALTAAGGVAAAAAAVTTAGNSAAVARARASFATPPGGPDGTAASDRPDPRASTYGRDIPLRARPSSGSPLPPAGEPAQRGGDAAGLTVAQQARRRWRPGGSCR
jgi:hypothetical protein